MRSSVACQRCRRSKVKCVNEGIGTTCRGCEQTNRECVYPAPTPSSSRKREASLSGGRSESYNGQDGDKRARPKRNSVATHIEALSLKVEGGNTAISDLLDPSILTRDVWLRLFQIFNVHYAADLSFLHEETFMKPIHKQVNMPPPPTTTSDWSASSGVRPDASVEFLLAYLALTTRFHADLMKRLKVHYNIATADFDVSDLYAQEASNRLAKQWAQNQQYDLEGIQALLMLSLHDWGMARGSKAWICLGMAIRSAQALGLPYEDDEKQEPLIGQDEWNAEAKALGIKTRKSSGSSLPAEEKILQKEIRRRTIWSCFTLDRFMSSGKNRPRMLRTEELLVNLPASENSFAWGHKVQTRKLRDEVDPRRKSTVASLMNAPSHTGNSQSQSPNGHIDEDDAIDETGEEEGLVSRYMRALEVYDKIFSWMIKGGRREKLKKGQTLLPPWNPSSQFYMLNKEVLNFKETLPTKYQLTPRNTRAHVQIGQSTPYALLHVVILLCQVMLHREWVPFTPVLCKGPEGPIDAPKFPKEQYKPEPESYWEDSAKVLFSSARGLVDLLLTLRARGIMMETPFTGFALYIGGFCGIYAKDFPQMDPGGFFHSVKGSTSKTLADDDTAPKAVEQVLDVLLEMRQKWKMSTGWTAVLHRVDKYYKQFIRQHREAREKLTSSDSDSGSKNSNLYVSLREGGEGGNLGVWEKVDRLLISFGHLEIEDAELFGDVQRPLSRSRTHERSESSGFKQEDTYDRRPSSALESSRSDGFNPINQTASSSRNGSISNSNSFPGFRPSDGLTSPVQYQQYHPPQVLPAVGSFRPTNPSLDGTSRSTLQGMSTPSTPSAFQYGAEHGNGGTMPPSPWDIQASNYASATEQHQQYPNAYYMASQGGVPYAYHSNGQATDMSSNHNDANESSDAQMANNNTLDGLPPMHNQPAQAFLHFDTFSFKQGELVGPHSSVMPGYNMVNGVNWLEDIMRPQYGQPPVTTSGVYAS